MLEDTGAGKYWCWKILVLENTGAGKYYMLVLVIATAGDSFCLSCKFNLQL